MNALFVALGIESWKPLATTLILPPLPFIVLVLAGARLMFRRRLLAWLLVLLGCGGLYVSSTEGMGRLLNDGLLHPPPALTTLQLADLKRAPKTAIVVLGGGRRALAPEYGISTLKPRTAERLRYGVWLSRETGLPLAFSGGIGFDAEPGPSEAEIATRVADREFGRPLRWSEGESRDTHENALRTVALLQPQGIEQIVLVTEQYHMPRALRNFEDAAAGRANPVKIVPAPMAVSRGRMRAADWLPSMSGFESNWLAWHEVLGRLMGA